MTEMVSDYEVEMQSLDKLNKLVDALSGDSPVRDYLLIMDNVKEMIRSAEADLTTCQRILDILEEKITAHKMSEAY